MTDRPDVETLRPLISPRSIAIVGASDDPTRIGGRPLGYMLKSGFQGPIWPVNPKRETVQGLQAFASVDALPGAPDACIVAVPAAAVPDTLEALAAKGDARGAAKKFETAAKYAPNWGRLHLRWAQALARQGKTAEAREHRALCACQRCGE